MRSVENFFWLRSSQSVRINQKLGTPQVSGTAQHVVATALEMFDAGSANSSVPEVFVRGDAVVGIGVQLAMMMGWGAP